MTAPGEFCHEAVMPGWYSAIMPSSDSQSLIIRQQQEQELLFALQKKPSDENLKNDWAALCKSNLLFLQDYVKNNGWPNAKKAGKDTEHAAFLIAQHGDTSRLLGNEWQHNAAIIQTDILHAMQRGGAKPGYIAFVTDRICFNRGEPQVYGTVPIDNYPLLNPEQLEERRTKMGLNETRAEYLARLKAGDNIPFRKIMESSSQAVISPSSNETSQTNRKLGNTIALLSCAVGVVFCLSHLPLLGLGMLIGAAFASPTLREQCQRLINPQEHSLFSSSTPSTIMPLNQRAMHPDFSNLANHPAHQATERVYSHAREQLTQKNSSSIFR